MHWINDGRAGADEKEPVFVLLQDELNRLGLPGRNDHCNIIAVIKQVEGFRLHPEPYSRDV